MDLTEILDIDVQTIRRDIQQLRQRGMSIPTWEQQKDIGFGATHKVQAMIVFLEEKEPLQIVRTIKHSMTAVERYGTFCCVVYC